MKIAIYHNLPSGGGKRALFEITRRLAERHEVDVYTLETAEHDFCDLRPFVPRHIVFPFQPLPLTRRPFGRLNQGIRGVDLLRLEAVQRVVAEQIDEGQYDVTFFHNCKFNQSPGLLKFTRMPSVFYSQEPPRVLYEPPTPRPSNQFTLAQRVGNLFDPMPGLYRRTLRRLDRDNVRAAGTVLVNSDYSREAFYRIYGVFASVSYLGVDTDCFRPLPLPKERRVLSVGSLTSNKGFDFVVRSLSLIEAARRPALVIISNYVDPAEQSYLQQLARTLDVELEMRAEVSDAALVAAYNQAQLTVYAPIMEPFGFVPLESMACGTPVVGVREAGVRETIVHDKTGLLVERDPAQFAEAVDALLADPERMVRCGKQGRGHVQANWTWRQSVDGIEAHLRRAARVSP